MTQHCKNPAFQYKSQMTLLATGFVLQHQVHGTLKFNYSLEAKSINQARYPTNPIIRLCISHDAWSQIWVRN